MKEAPFVKQRQELETLFRAGLAAVHGTQCVADYLQHNLLESRPCVVAIGKAASAMMSGAQQVLGERFQGGLLITRDGHADQALLTDKRVTCMEAGHPVPDVRSLQAGDRLCRFLDAVPLDSEILFLISGGASSLVEVLPETTSLLQLQQLNQWLLASGLDISAINRVRRSVSLIKGGGLLEYRRGRETTALLISDVAGDDPAIIGSGLLYQGAPRDLSGLDLPDWIMDMVCAAGPGSGTDRQVVHQVIANLDMALQAAALAGHKLGYPAQTMAVPLEGEAADVGARLVVQLRERQPGLYLWGGETTVSLPSVPGQGGRNQHLALAAACTMSAGDNIVLLSAGTDGTDGVTQVAGAIVDPATLARGAARGFDPVNCLRQADSGSFLEASGDIIRTGPTGTNVTDMVIALKLADDCYG